MVPAGDRFLCPGSLPCPLQSLTKKQILGVDSAGMSPAEIFGLERDEMEQFLNGLARNYPDYISFTTTHDLEVVRLVDDKTSASVLTLF